MAIKSETPNAEDKLNAREFSQARKDMAFGRLSEDQWTKADPRQKDILHNIELLINSLTEEEVDEILETNAPEKTWF